MGYRLYQVADELARKGDGWPVYQHVYLISTGELYKIGFTHDGMFKRLHNLESKWQTYTKHHAFKIEHIIWAGDEAQPLETALHRKFKDKSADFSHEWYSGLTPDDVQWIKSIQKPSDVL